MGSEENERDLGCTVKPGKFWKFFKHAHTHTQVPRFIGFQEDGRGKTGRTGGHKGSMHSRWVAGEGP